MTVAIAREGQARSTPSWWRWWRIALAALVAAAVFGVAFVYRFNGLGGSLGGFDNDHFVRLLRSDMVLDGQQPLRDFADAELRGAWPSLGYELPAWAQRRWGRTLLVEAYLTVGALAVAASAVFLLALDLSRRWLVALIAAMCVIASGPKLYNYDKVLVLAVAAVLIRMWLVKPSWVRLAGLSAATAVATLFRHDYGVYVAMSAAAAMLARGPWLAWTVFRRLAAYTAITTALLIPSILWVHTYEGLVPYFQSSLASVRGESVRTELDRPTVDLSAGFDARNLISAAYYAFWAVTVAALAAIAVIAWQNVRRKRFDAVDLSTGIALLVLALMAVTFFLRNNLGARFGDAIVPVVLLAAWVTGVIPGWKDARRVTSVGGWIAARALLVVLMASLFVVGGVEQELRAAGMSASWDKVTLRFHATRAELLPLPPQTWGDTNVVELGTLVAARYLAECTDRDDRVLIVTYAPEIPVFARRLFAGGQGTFGLNFYQDESQQRRTVARLQRQSTPIVLGSFDDLEGEFVEDYSHVYDYVTAHYREAGTIAVDGKPRFRVFVETAREPRRIHPDFGLPCFR